jgi:glycosyltransferase involved in cell wall biosynthesis
MLVTLEPISRSMAGPAIRAVEMAKQLANEFVVTVASPVPQAADDQLPPIANVKIVTGANRQAMYREALDNDILIIQSNVLRPYPKLSELGKFLVVDLYDPYLFSVLVQYKHEKVAGEASYRLMHQVLERHMLKCDFSICASEIQRDYWIGRYCALGRLTPAVYEFDPSLRKLIDVVPFGRETLAPQRNGPGLRDEIDAIGRDDVVLLWGGGIWDWFDPLTLISAVAKAKDSVPNLRLVFMGMKSPNPKVPIMKMAKDAVELSEKLGLTGQHVFFKEGWIPYEKRVNYLLDADVAVSAHFDSPETRYSFRTRILDYLWCGLPVLSTGGDPLSEMIDRAGAGLALPYKDEIAWCDAIVRLAGERDFREKFSRASAELSNEFTWDRTCKALLRFCRDPYQLPPHVKITMPSVFERARAVYARGGGELVKKRTREIISDLFG